MTTVRLEDEDIVAAIGEYVERHFNATALHVNLRAAGGRFSAVVAVNNNSPKAGRSLKCADGEASEL